MSAHDVIVVGGGVLGATAAYLAAREGLKTLLVDRLDTGRATDAGAGIISTRTSVREEVLFELGLRASDYYATLTAALAEDGGGDTGYARSGDIRVAVDEDELAPFGYLVALVEQRRARYAAAMADVREISPEDACALFPPLARPRRAIYDRSAARVDGRLLNRALLTAAANRGLAVLRASVDRLVLERGRVTGVAAAGELHRTERVIVAGGAWSPAFAAQLGIDIPVAPQRGQIIHLSMRDAPTGDWPIVHAFHDHYLVTWGGGRVVAGATRETGSGFDPRVTAGGVHTVLSEALRVAPGLGGAELIEVRVGLRPMSADGLPIVGPVPGADGLYLATGHGPSGLTYGPYSARVVVDLMLGRAGDLDLGPYAVTRFAR